MQATTTPDVFHSCTDLLGAPAGDLVLKICGGEHDGRVLRLAAAKCLIGSAAGCTLRLRARGIRPVHALILRGPAGALIRCWSADAQLNGRGFTESFLEVGDQLRIGPVTLSVTELTASALPVQAKPLAVRDDQAFMPTHRKSRFQRQRRKQLFKHLRQERAQHTNLQATIDSQRERLAAFEAQIAQLQAAVHDAETNRAGTSAGGTSPAVSAPAIDDVLNLQLSKTIEQLRQELDAAARRRALEQQAHDGQRAAWEAQAEQRRLEDFEQLRLQFQSEQDQHIASATAELRSNFEHQLAALEQQRLELTRDIDVLKAAVEAKTRSEEAARRSAAVQIEQLTETFDLVRRERDELFERLHNQRQASDAHSSDRHGQLEEVRRQAQLQIAEARAAAQKEVLRLREEFAARERQLDETLIAQSSGEMQRSASDAERILRLTTEVESLRAEAKVTAAAFQQQQDGFTQARKRLEAEISELNAKVQASGEALHEARENSGLLQAAVLAEAEQARAQRDAVREQMLRQQQDWTEFRSRLEAAAAAEREMAQSRYDALQAELVKCEQTQAQVEAERETLQQRLHKIEIELEQAQEALFAAEHGANERLQQMTVSMEQLRLERDGAQSPPGADPAEWEKERNALAQCVAELQQEVSQLTAKLEAVEQEARKSTADSHSQMETAELQLQAAREQVAQWQAAAEQARQQSDEFSQSLARLQSQEQAWQLEREQWDRQQQLSTERLHQLEAAISELQQQLSEAQRAVAITCPSAPQANDVPPSSADLGCTINVNNQELAALREQMQAMPSEASEFGSTINVNNQELAAIREQAHEPVPSLLAPREIFTADQREAFQAREEALQAQADELAEQQAQLEEEQAIVARQRIELEQFEASLIEFERSLTQRAEALLQQASAVEPDASPAISDYHDASYGEPERESNQLSESEAFAAMADHVASLHPPQEFSAVVHPPADSGALNDDSAQTFDAVQENAFAEAPSLSGSSEKPEFSVEDVAGESLLINSPPDDEPASESSAAADDQSENDSPAVMQHLPDENAPEAAKTVAESESPEANSDPDGSSTIIAPVAASDDFENDLDAHIARVMRREQTDWQVAPSSESATEGVAGGDETGSLSAPSQTEAVNSVLDRLREAGLWKGEGTAKADQLPSSNPPLDEGVSLCRQSHIGPIGSEETEDPTPDSNVVHANAEVVVEAELDVAPPAYATPPATLLNPTANEDHEADDSIESYMSRLMQRLRTSNPEEEPSPRKTSGTAKQPLVPAAAPTSAPAPKVTDSRPLTSLEELAPRSQAPELNSNLAAMRELANSAARGAIETHQHQHKRQRVNMRTIHTILALIVGAGLIFGWYRTGSWAALGGAGLSLLWALGSSVVAALQSLALRRPNIAADPNSIDDQAAK